MLILGMMNEVISKQAADLVKIACAFGGFDKVEILSMALAHTDRKINVTTIENILEKIYDKGSLNEIHPPR